MNKNKLAKMCQAALNCYVFKEWFKKEKCTYRKVFDRTEDFEIKNMQGYFGYNKKEKSTLYIVLRGSDEKADWNLNLKFLLRDIKRRKKIRPFGTNIKVHEGFHKGFLLISDMMFEKVDNYKKIIIVSHSMGAAVGTILAIDLQAHYLVKKIINIPFSSPRVGNNAFAKFYNSFGIETYRIYKDGDIVCKMPQVFLGYKHVKTKYCLGKLPWWRIISKIFGLPIHHYPQILIPLIKKEM